MSHVRAMDSPVKTADQFGSTVSTAGQQKKKGVKVQMRQQEPNAFGRCFYLEDVRTEGTSSALKRSRPLLNLSASTSGVSHSRSDTYKEAPAGAEKPVLVFGAGAEVPQMQKEPKKSTSDKILGTVGENKLCGGTSFFQLLL